MSLQVAEDPGVLCKEGGGWECNVLLLWLDFLSSSVLLRLTVEDVPSMNVVSWRLKNKLSLLQILILLGGGVSVAALSTA